MSIEKTIPSIFLRLAVSSNIIIYFYSKIKIVLFIFFALLRTVLCERSIYTRDIFRDTRIVKNHFRGFGPDVTLSVRYGPITGWN